MAAEDDGLGLSLSLKCPDNPPPPFPIQKPSFNDPFQFFANRSNAESRSHLRGIDVNRTPETADCEEELGVSSPNSTISSVSGKRSEREENEAERASSSLGISDDDYGGGGGEAAPPKKLRLSKEQAAVLEETFKEHNALSPKQKVALAKQLNLRPRQVEVWFQNRRARTKLKQTEVDCEYLKTCCEKLTEENRRLQKEVNELRALKLSPQLYTHMTPPTTLTMCPSCERVAVPSSSSSTATPSTLATIAAANARHLNNSLGPHQQRPHVTISSWATMPPIPHHSLGAHYPRS